MRNEEYKGTHPSNAEGNIPIPLLEKTVLQVVQYSRSLSLGAGSLISPHHAYPPLSTS